MRPLRRYAAYRAHLLLVHPQGGSLRISLPGRRRVSPVSTTAVPTFHAPYAAGFLEAASPSPSPLLLPSPSAPRLGSRLPPCGENFTTRQASFHTADRWLAPSHGGLDPTLRRPGLPTRRWAATKVTWLLLWPDFHRQVVVDLQDARAESFRWTSMTRWALPSSACNRATS
jgi:hypothetical protein